MVFSPSGSGSGPRLFERAQSGKTRKAWNNSEHESGSTFFLQAGGIAGLGGFLIPLGLMFGIMYSW